MKLTIITAFFPPEKGAAPYRILNTAKELHIRGLDVDVITTLANYPTGKLFEGYRWRLFKKETIEGIICRRYWLYPSNSNNPFIRILSMLSYCFSLIFTIPLLYINKPDLVLVQTPPLLSGLVAAFISKSIGAKVLLNVSDIWPLTAAELGVMRKESLSFKFFSKIESLMYKFSDSLMAQSNETFEYLSKKTNKSVFLYRNLTKPYFNKSKSIITNNSKKKIVYAGLLGLAQGVFKICKHINFNKYDIEFHIYGNGVERSIIESYIYKNPDCNIFLHLPIGKDEIQNIILNFDATIVPLSKNIYGAFPSKIAMAMASALPIFFSGGGEGYEIVKKFNIGYVSNAGDLVELENNIKIFSKLSNEDIKEFKKNIINIVKNNFDYKKQQLSLFNFIKEQI
jgi:glycosyltransferase involved in cell wall biosynthesis